jgi:hypothetical protein
MYAQRVSVLLRARMGTKVIPAVEQPRRISFEVLREYHTALGQLIPRYEGTLEHFA